MSNTTHTIELTTDELKLIKAALQTVSPSGGGSAPFCLYMKLNGGQYYIEDEAKRNAEAVLIMDMCETVIKEAIEADVIKATLIFERV